MVVQKIYLKKICNDFYEEFKNKIINGKKFIISYISNPTDIQDFLRVFYGFKLKENDELEFSFITNGNEYYGHRKTKYEVLDKCCSKFEKFFEVIIDSYFIDMDECPSQAVFLIEFDDDKEYEKYVNEKLINSSIVRIFTLLGTDYFQSLTTKGRYLDENDLIPSYFEKFMDDESLMKNHFFIWKSISHNYDYFGRDVIEEYFIERYRFLYDFRIDESSFKDFDMIKGMAFDIVIYKDMDGNLKAAKPENIVVSLTHREFIDLEEELDMYEHFIPAEEEEDKSLKNDIDLLFLIQRNDMFNKLLSGFDLYNKDNLDTYGIINVIKPLID